MYYSLSSNQEITRLEKRPNAILKSTFIFSAISSHLLISLLLCNARLGLQVEAAPSAISIKTAEQSLLPASSDVSESILQAPQASTSSQTRVSSPISSNVQNVLNNNGAGDAKQPSAASLTDHLETQETGYLHNGPAPYSHSPAEGGYNYDKNAYGKQAADWSLYDQGNHGHYDKYGDKAWNEQGHNGQSSQGKHDSYGNNYNTQNSGHGSGYYSRDRGYGYEKHYAYDKEVASKQHADNHNTYGSNHGLHDYYGNTESKSHGNQGHDKYGQLSRYGNHGYGRRGAHLNAHQDYEHNQNKYATLPQYSSSHHHHHLPAPPLPPLGPQHVSSYSADYHVPTYRSTYADYSPQVGYPSSYPSYY